MLCYVNFPSTEQNKQPQWNLIRPSKSGTSFLLVRMAWDPEVTDLFRYCCLGSRLLQLLLLLLFGDRPTSDVYSRWSGLSIINKKTECILFTAASRVHPAVRMFRFCYLLEPGLSLQWHHLSHHHHMSHHSCWTNCNSLTTLCPYFPHGSLQTPFKTLTASFPRSIFQPTLPPSTQNIFCTLLTFGVDSPPWPSSWEENLHPFRFQFPEAGTYIAVPQTDATGVLVVLST